MRCYTEWISWMWYHCCNSIWGSWGAAIAKARYLSDLGFKTFEKLFCYGYCSERWGFKNVQSSDSIQERAIRFYLGLVCIGFLLYLHLGGRLGGVKEKVIDGLVWYVIGTDWVICLPLD